jgi:hypothetical protein
MGQYLARFHFFHALAFLSRVFSLSCCSFCQLSGSKGLSCISGVRHTRLSFLILAVIPLAFTCIISHAPGTITHFVTPCIYYLPLHQHFLAAQGRRQRAASSFPLTLPSWVGDGWMDGWMAGLYALSFSLEKVWNDSLCLRFRLKLGLLGLVWAVFFIGSHRCGPCGDFEKRCLSLPLGGVATSR